MRNLQEYVRAASPQEAVDIKRRRGEEAVYLAGGSDLLVHKPEQARVAIDIRFIGLSECGSDGEWHRIGGTALLREAETKLGYLAGGMLSAALRDTAPWLIRNAATVAGNVANASPAADSVPALVALDAELEMLNANGETESITVEAALVGPHQTALNGRLITAIRIPARPEARRGAFVKQARSKSDIALVNLAVTYILEQGVARNVRIALGAVAPTVMRAREAERVLEGHAPEPAVLSAVQAAVYAEVRPISDHRASEAYRRRLSGVLVRRALEQVAV